MTKNQTGGRGERGVGRGRGIKPQQEAEVLADDYFDLGVGWGMTRGKVPTYVEMYNVTRKYLNMCRVFYVGHDKYVQPKLATF